MSKERHVCENCRIKFKGTFCNECGEKVVSASDFSVKHLLSQALGAFTNLDSKFFKTFKSLLFYPGLLTKKYLSGIRVPYLKPFQVFLIGNIFFFIFLSDIDIFRSPARWYFYMDSEFYQTSVMEQVEKVMKENEITLTEAKIKYDKISGSLAKSLLVILIPFIGLISMMYSRKMEYGKHLVFATHFFAFLLVAITLVYLVTDLLSVSGKWTLIIPTLLLTGTHYLLSVRNFYRIALWKILSLGLIGFILIYLFISAYRAFINVLTIELM